MRIRALAVISLLALPSGLTAQGVRLPRPGRATTPQPAPLPPEIPAVTRALQYKRSRWSAEAYSFVSSLDLPSTSGGVNRATGAGAGTRADYRYSDNFSATVDLTAMFLGNPAVVETAEVGTRYSPLSWSQQIRPFFDVRAAYMHMYDTFSLPASAAAVGALNQDFVSGTRYSRGFGGVGGAGLEFSLTRSVALTTELSAMRNRMTLYRSTAPTSIPTGNAYWMTSYRYTFGLKFNPTRALQLAQNPTQ